MSCSVGHFRLRRSNSYMRPIATDGVAWSIGLSVYLSVCLLITFVSPAKTAEPT